MLVKHILNEMNRQDTNHFQLLANKNGWPKYGDLDPADTTNPNAEFSNQEIPGSLQSIITDLGINFQGDNAISPKNAEQAALTDRAIAAIEQLSVAKEKDLNVGPTAVKYTLPDGIVWVKNNKPSYYNSIIWRP